MRFAMLLVGLVALCLFASGFGGPAHAEKRVALVIGNSAYRNVPVLPNPRNDAAAMAEKLEGMGFEVVSGEDLDLAALRAKVREFVGRLNGAQTALFFYAGHGLQVSGENYMAPVDAKLASRIDLDFETVPMSLVLSAMEQSAKVNLVFLDACRDNPLAENLARSMGTRSAAVGRGLARIGSGVGSLVAFSTQPGNVALDGSGANSPYTTALLKHLGEPGEDIARSLVRVRNDVLAATGGKQVPWENSSLTGEVVLVPKPGEPAPPPAANVAPSKADNQVELAYWDSIKGAGSKAYFESYLARYPDGLFADIARLKIAEIGHEERRSAEALENAKREEARKAEEKAAEEARLAELRAAEAARKEIEKKLAELKAAQRQLQPDPAKPGGGPAAGEVQQTPADDQTRDLKIAALSPTEAASEQQPAAMDDRELVRGIQEQLNRLGCDAGKADGMWGSASRNALGQFARQARLKLASLEPSPDLYRRLKAEKARICPLVCGRGMEEKAGRCVASRKEAAPVATATPDAAPARPASERPSAVVRNSLGRICKMCRNAFAGEAFSKTCLSDLGWQNLASQNTHVCKPL